MPKIKRKNESKVEEVKFDPEARREFLTGFHKRKVARIKHAQAAAAEKAKEDHREFRKQLRESRQANLDEMRKAFEAENGDLGLDDEDEGMETVEITTIEPKEEEYVTESEGEEKHATVVIEPIKLDSDSEEDEDKEPERDASGRIVKKEEPKPKKGKDGEDKKKKEKKKKHRYLTKGERKDDRRKQAASKAKIKAKYAKDDTGKKTKGGRVSKKK